MSLLKTPGKAKLAKSTIGHELKTKNNKNSRLVSLSFVAKYAPITKNVITAT